MGWEQRLESLRGRLEADPAGVHAEILHELVYGPDIVASPSVRVRLYGLLVASYRILGELDEGVKALKIGSSIGGSPTARIELLAQGALVHLERRDATAALDCLDASQELLQRELQKTAGEPLSQKREQWLLNAKARNLVVRGEIALHLGIGSLKSATTDALEALTLTSHRSALRAQMAAITLLSNLLTRFGTLAGVTEALRLLDRVDKDLARRRFRRSHDYRVRIRWGRALALARLGMVDRAEQIMAEVIEKLIEAGARQAAENAVEALAWIVAERAGHEGRAEYLKRRYRTRLSTGVES